MWAGASDEAGGHAGYGLASETPANFIPAAAAAAAAANNSTIASSVPPTLSSANMPYPWDHHHLRHHEEVAVSQHLFFHASIRLIVGALDLPR